MEKERITQNRVIDWFQKELNYRYLGNLFGLDNQNIREDDLKQWLKKRGVSNNLISGSLSALQKENYVGNGRRLYDANQAIYSLLRYGVSVKTGIGEKTQTVMLIDWKNPLNNDFAIAEEVRVRGAKYDARPDLVLYVNGIALAVIELKRSSVSVGDGIRQNISNQKPEFIEKFFTTVQLIMAGNDSEGLRYGVIDTPEKYYLQWREDNQETLGDLDADLKSLCSKNRLIQIIHDFMVFDKGSKKTCRHNQFFAIQAACEKLKQRQGGIIWHTQGSGKSLTMVWLAQWILEQGKDNRVLVITDRTELDEQIEKVFSQTGHSIHHATSGQDLLNVLNKSSPSLVCSLVHKFGRKGEQDENNDVELNEYLTQIQSQAGDFSPKGNIVVFVDECHRTQSGRLHAAMKTILPNAIFIGFTGTPLLKKDKKTSVQVFGDYIHRYRFNEAVRDGVILDLLYEARDVDQYLSSPKQVDLWFENRTRGMTNIAKSQLKQRWGTMQKLLSCKNRLEKIGGDILIDMDTKPRLANGSGNAIFVCSSVYQACQMYEFFDNSPLKGKVAIITSFKPNATAIKTKSTGNGESEEEYKYKIYRRMLADYFRQGRLKFQVQHES